MQTNYCEIWSKPVQRITMVTLMFSCVLGYSQTISHVSSDAEFRSLKDPQGFELEWELHGNEAILRCVSPEGQEMWSQNLSAEIVTIRDVKTTETTVVACGNFSGWFTLAGDKNTVLENGQAFLAVWHKSSGNLIWLCQLGDDTELITRGLVSDPLGLSLVGEVEGIGFHLPIPMKHLRSLESFRVEVDLNQTWIHLRTISLPWLLRMEPPNQKAEWADSEADPSGPPPT